MKKKIAGLLILASLSTVLVGCGTVTPDSNTKQKAQTKELMNQADSKLGMPNVKNFYEKAMMKTIIEDCDKSNLVTYAYVKNDMTGKLVYLGQAMGYGLPFGTEYTNPQYIANSYSQGGFAILPQPDPNGLFKPADVNATWLMLIDPATKKAKPVYVESDLTVSPFKLPRNLLDQSSLPGDY
jgi:hypothetical protein